MATNLVAPYNVFQLIEKKVLKNPAVLEQGHYHTRADGKEAITADDIKQAAAHCLLGWIVFFTPGAPEQENGRDDMLAFVNRLLFNANKPPLTWATTVGGDYQDARKILAGRAAEERALP